MNKQVKLQKPPVMSFEEKLTKEENTAFFEHASDRAAAIMWSAILENHLTAVIKMLMRRDSDAVSKELFRPSGPVGPFGTKVSLAYMLRLLAPESYSDFLTVSKIRNKFVHDLSQTSFEDQNIAAMIKNMHLYSIVGEMAKTPRAYKTWPKQRSNGSGGQQIQHQHERFISTIYSIHDSRTH